MNVLASWSERILDMSELQTVSRNDRIELHSLIEEVLTDLEPLAQAKKVELIQRSQGAGAKADEELFLTGSDILIYRMLYNLVENAIKYNKEGGEIRVWGRQHTEWKEDYRDRYRNRNS